MSTKRAIVAGAASPVILGSIATPVLGETARSRDAFEFLAEGDGTGQRERFARLGRAGGFASLGRAVMRWRSF